MTSVGFTMGIVRWECECLCLFAFIFTEIDEMCQNSEAYRRHFEKRQNVLLGL